MSCETSDADLKRALSQTRASKIDFSKTFLQNVDEHDITERIVQDYTKIITDTEKYVKKQAENTEFKMPYTDVRQEKDLDIDIGKKTLDKSCKKEEPECLPNARLPTKLTKEEKLYLRIAINRNKMDFLNAQRALIRRNLLYLANIEKNGSFNPDEYSPSQEEKELDRDILDYLTDAGKAIEKSAFYLNVLLEDEQ